MKLAFIGAGYVGLVTAAVFADLGNDCWVVEIDKEKIESLNKGKVPFYEPGLGELVSKGIEHGRLHFTGKYPKAIPGAEIVFICVGTPNKNGKINLEYLFSAAKMVAENLQGETIVVVKSTVPPGINREVEARMKKDTKVKFEMASVPEFLREGKALEDSLNPHRVVIGAERKEVAEKLLELHKPLSGERLICDPTSAQMIKYASNTFLATKISFANSIAILCDQVGANAQKVLKGVGLDKRIGPDFLAAGLGYGGSCFPKDIKALIEFADSKKYNFRILKSVEETNAYQVKYFLNKTLKACGGSVKNKIIVVLGLAFKPDTSDIRESRSVMIIDELQKMGAKVRATDPVAIEEAKKILNGVEFYEDPYLALEGAEAMLLVTEWGQYQVLDFDRIKTLMNSLVVIDGRNIYNSIKLKEKGFYYQGIGQ